MSTYTQKQISSLDSPALTDVITNWKDYDAKTVLLSYAEMKRRNDFMSDRLFKDLQEFCVKNNQTNINDFLLLYLKENGSASYTEKVEKELLETKATSLNLKDSSGVSQMDGNNKYPTLKAISKLYAVSAVIIAICTVIVSVVFLIDGTNSIYKTIISLISGTLIVLGLMAASELIILFIDIERNTRLKK